MNKFMKQCRMHELKTQFKIGAKRGLNTTSYLVIAAGVGALQKWYFSHGDEPKERAHQVGLASSLATFGALVLVNGLSVIIYNRPPQSHKEAIKDEL